MKSNHAPLLLATLLSTQAFAADSKKVELPEICKTVINYTIQAMNTHFADKYGPADSYDPDSLTLKKDFTTYPMANVKYAIDCDKSETHSKWCMVAGGSPVVYQADVEKVAPADAKGNSHHYQIATVVVTYNRGGCRIDEIQ